MNIETLLEAAKYVESGGALAIATAAEHSFTRGKDEVDNGDPKGASSYTPSILEKQLTGSPPPPKRARTKSPGPRYSETQHLLPPASQHVIPPPTSQAPITIATSIPVSSSSSIIQHAPRYPATTPPVSYHLYTHIPPQHLQQHHPVHQQQQQQQHHPRPSQQHPQLLPQHVQQHHFQALTHHQQAENQQPQRYVAASVANAVLSTQPPAPPPTHPPPVPPHPLLSPPPASSAGTSPRVVGPSQAMDLLQLAESQGHKYTTLNNVTSPRARSSPGSHHDNISPRLVHQIVSHNQWVAGERPGSPKQSPGHPKASGESDSNDSANDGSGKDKRAGIREVHNKLEKNRRAHLKDCFENLRNTVPNMEDKKAKTSNLSILRGALRFIQVLTRKERELEHELDRLVRQKIEAQQRLDLLKIKNGLTIGKPIKLPTLTGREEEEIEEDDDDDEEERLVVVEDKDVDVTVDDEIKNEVEDDQVSTSTASEAEEEERKSRAQSRSQSPLHQPVSSSHLSYSLPGVSYQQAFASFQGAIKETPPYTHAASRPVGLSRSANEAMLRFTTMRDAQPPQGSDPLRPKQKLPEAILPRHGSAPSLGTSAIPPQRTTYMQMTQDNVSSVLHSVANQISPVTRIETPIVVSQSSGALAGSVTRQTVSQLLGKQPVVRQPVRRQLSVSQLPVIQHPLQTPHHLLPRIMNTNPSLRLGFNPTTQGVIGPAKPVVTVGINSLLAQPSVIQTTSTHRTVISNGSGTTVPDPSTVTFTAKPTTPSVITASPFTTPIDTSPLITSVLGTSTAGVSRSTSLMTASVITQTLPVMSHTGHNQFIPPIALQSPANAGASLLFHPSSYIGLPHSMLPQPFLGSFAATRPSHIQLATSTQVSPSFAASQPLVHPSTQPIDSANLLALAQALPKQMPPAQFPSALSIGSLASPGTLLSTNLSAVNHGSFTTVSSTPISAAPAVKNAMSAAAPASKKSKSSASGSSGGKGSRSKHGKSLNGKTEIQITTSKIAETMATLANTQVIANNGHSTSTVNNRSSQQSVVVKL
ncbi:uncharacterized protein LOC100889261 [Strongylocentrotus purpuratus]|uniref:Max-binding protein MNT n=1 Tax=Strongylocentrotus purpuratus TaxID=7668 RepID=A0A7M7GIC3_STRPU|nr:uncharacterized protein LOC100889261 [Strongylocentrotus purpuratus]